MKILDALQIHAEHAPTTYFLEGRMAYVDEIFSPEGFLPLIGRMAERRLRRSLDMSHGMLPPVGTPEQRQQRWDSVDYGIRISEPDTGGKHCGFSYIPYRESIFTETINAAPAGENIFEDSLRLAALVLASRHVVGMGMEGAVDLTPVYEFFMEMKQEDRDALRKEEILVWPLYQPVRVS